VTTKPPRRNGHSWLEEGGADLRRYLLGQMSEREEAQVERDYLASDAALEELRAREDELIEDYLAGSLEPSEQDRFERVFLATPARLQRLIFIRALHDRAAEPRAVLPRSARSTRPWVGVAAALGAVAVAGLVAARALDTRLAVRDAMPLPVRAEAAVSGAARAEVHTTPAPAVSLRLREPAVRGTGDVPTLDPGPAGQLALEAPVDPRDGFAAHRGRVTAPDGREAFLSPWQPNRGETVLRIVLPASSLRDGRHVLVVEGRSGTSEEPVEGYAFRIRRR
jgi:hypothetical protein